MPFILFNSRQRRRVLVISFKQSFSRRTTYISSGILQKPTPTLPYILILIENTSRIEAHNRRHSNCHRVIKTLRQDQHLLLWSQARPLSNQRCVATIIQPPMHTHLHLIARHRQREEARNIPQPLKCEEPYSKLSVLRVGVTEYRRLATNSSVHESRRQCSQYKTYIVLLKCNKTTIPQRLIIRRREQIVLHTIQQNESETNTSLLGTAHNIIIPIRLLKATI